MSETESMVATLSQQKQELFLKLIEIPDFKRYHELDVTLSTLKSLNGNGHSKHNGAEVSAVVDDKLEQIAEQVNTNGKPPRFEQWKYGTNKHSIKIYNVIYDAPVRLRVEDIKEEYECTGMEMNIGLRYLLDQNLIVRHRKKTSSRPSYGIADYEYPQGAAYTFDGAEEIVAEARQQEQEKIKEIIVNQAPLTKREDEIFKLMKANFGYRVCEVSAFMELMRKQLKMTTENASVYFSYIKKKGYFTKPDSKHFQIIDTNVKAEAPAPELPSKNHKDGRIYYFIEEHNLNKNELADYQLLYDTFVIQPGVANQNMTSADGLIQMLINLEGNKLIVEAESSKYSIKGWKKSAPRVVKSENQEDYPIQDEIWPSRRWNKDRTDYIDLSGGEKNNGEKNKALVAEILKGQEESDEPTKFEALKQEVYVKIKKVLPFCTTGELYKEFLHSDKATEELLNTALKELVEEKLIRHPEGVETIWEALRTGATVKKKIITIHDVEQYIEMVGDCSRSELIDMFVKAGKMNTNKLQGRIDKLINSEKKVERLENGKYRWRSFKRAG